MLEQAIEVGRGGVLPQADDRPVREAEARVTVLNGTIAKVNGRRIAFKVSCGRCLKQHGRAKILAESITDIFDT
jgi:hypothetical protein